MNKLLPILAALIVALVAVPAGAEVVLDKTMAPAGAKVLELEAGGGEIVLTPDAGADGVRVKVEQNKSIPPPQMQSIRIGNRLAVTLRPPSEPPIIPFVPSEAATYDVTYPAAMRLDLRISSGNIHIAKPIAAVEIYDQDGNVAIDNPRGAVTVEVAHGNLTVTDALAPIDLLADDGNVTANVATGWSGNEIRIQSATGAIRLAVPAGFRARLDASSDSGQVHNALVTASARTPFVWLYAQKGDVWITQAGL